MRRGGGGVGRRGEWEKGTEGEEGLVCKKKLN